MENKHLSTAITIGCLTICAGIVGMAAINRHNAATHGSNSISGMDQSYDQQSDSNTLISGSSNNNQCSLLSGAMLFHAGSEATAPTARLPLFYIRPATTPPSPNDPLAGYVLSGFVAVDGEAEAVLEQRSTKQSWYLKAGDLWQNYRVVSVAPGQIVLTIDGQQHALAMNDAFNAVPLLADAPYLKSRALRSGIRTSESIPYSSWIEELNDLQSADYTPVFDMTGRGDAGIDRWVFPATPDLTPQGGIDSYLGLSGTGYTPTEDAVVSEATLYLNEVLVEAGNGAVLLNDTSGADNVTTDNIRTTYGQLLHLQNSVSQPPSANGDGPIVTTSPDNYEEIKRAIENLSSD